MKFKINKGLLPIKAHYFFFFAALGPVLPQMNVFGRQLGVSAATMGMVTAVLPLLWAAAKPTFGYIVDYFTNLRKLIFMLLITLMTGSYCSLWFLPTPQELGLEHSIEKHIYQLNDTIFLAKISEKTLLENEVEKFNCFWSCDKNSRQNFEIWFSNNTYINAIFIKEDVTNISCSLYQMKFDDVREGQIVCTPKRGCDLICLEEDFQQNITKNVTKREIKTNKSNNYLNFSEDSINNSGLESRRVFPPNQDGVDKMAAGIQDEPMYSTATFWIFVILMCIGTVAFNVANCIGDAVCFDVLGDNGSAYGSQRAWGTIGYGLTALLGGALVDVFSPGTVKDFTPAFILALGFTAMDLISASKLKLPSLSSPEDSGKALRALLTMPRVLAFIFFAVLAGVFDSFIIYYMFWFLEELAEKTNHLGNIKLIEGVVVAAESFVGELLFFFLSGRIITRFGYGPTMSFCFVCYAIRLGLISLITNPWQLIAIEAILQGPTYALCYSSIVGYAARVAPVGYSATVQGVVAGMDDGLGFALGSLIGGQIYAAVGGRSAFRVMALVAAVAAAAHALSFSLTRLPDETKDKLPEIAEAVKMLSPEAVRFDNNEIYRDTVVPLQSAPGNDSSTL